MPPNPNFDVRGLDVLTCALLAGPPILIAYCGVGYLQAYERITRLNAHLLWTAAYSLSWISAVWFVFVRSRSVTFAALGWTQLSGRQKLFAVGVGLAALSVSWSVFSTLDAAGIDYGDFSLGMSSETKLVQAVTLAAFIGIVGPFAEELYFRGVLFRWMRQRASFWPSALGSSFVFGLVHIETAAIANAALAGVLFAVLFERSGSLLMPTIAHQTWNVTIVLMEWLTEVTS